MSNVILYDVVVQTELPTFHLDAVGFTPLNLLSMLHLRSLLSLSLTNFGTNGAVQLQVEVSNNTPVLLVCFSRH
jgi:hypothetical protein